MDTHPPRHHRPLASAPNFRDIGGYAARGGRPVRLGRVFRSGHLGALAPADMRHVEQLGVRQVLDLRGVQEREPSPCVLSGVQVHALSIEPTIVQKLIDLLDAGHRLTGPQVAELMNDTYRGFVRGNTHRFAQVFGHVLASDDPLVFHCTAGKDRTGFAAALIHHALGVSEADILRDYLLTNERRTPPPPGAHGLPPEAAHVLYGVEPGFLRAAMQAVCEDYGSVEGYLREGLGLGTPERRQLEDRLLAPAA